MLYDDEYQYFKNQVLKAKTKPYTMSNKELAEELFKRFKVEYPSSSIYYHGIMQYICLDDRARKNLIKKLECLKQEQMAKLDELSKLLSDLSMTKKVIEDVKNCDKNA